MQSPLGLVPKANDKTQLIFHLSYDFGSAESDKSVNHHTPEHLCSAKYRDLDHAICGCLHLLRKCGVNHQTISYSKTDCSNAFPLAPILVSQCYLLTMCAEDPLTKKLWFFIDKCLPFGSSRSCAIFQFFSDALAFLAKVRMVRSKIARNPSITNY